MKIPAEVDRKKMAGSVKEPFCTINRKLLPLKVRFCPILQFHSVQYTVHCVLSLKQFYTHPADSLLLCCLCLHLPPLPHHPHEGASCHCHNRFFLHLFPPTTFKVIARTSNEMFNLSVVLFTNPIVKDIGISDIDIALIYTVLPFTVFIAPPLVGFLADRLGITDDDASNIDPKSE